MAAADAEGKAEQVGEVLRTQRPGAVSVVGAAVGQSGVVTSQRVVADHDPTNRSGLSSRQPRLGACTLLVEPGGLG